MQWIELTDTAQACTISADYLIICADVFFDPSDPDSEVLRIANHRATYNGFDVAILNAETIISDGLGFYYEGLNIVPPDPTYKKEQRIRTCIRRVYEGANAQHTYDGKLGYVLLIGDTYPPGGNQGMPMSLDHGHLAPPSYQEPFPTDYYFSCVTRQQNIFDETGDLFIGRFCVDNNDTTGFDELHNVVEKTIFYETEATFGGWREETGVLVHEEFTNYMPHFFDFVENLVPSYFTVDEIDATQPNTHENIYQVINDGVGLFSYYGHGTPNGWSAGGYLDVSFFRNNLTNTNKAPVVHTIACETGRYDNWGDCIGETMVSYSETEGFTGYIGASRSVHANPTSWNNGLISDPPDRFQEILLYTIFNDLSHITGEYILESKTVYPSSWQGQYKYAFNFFGDPALNVMAQGFQVTQDVTLPAYTVISNEITVKEGATLTIPANAELHFEADGKLIIDESATLVISDFATIISTNASEIIIDGNITLGDNITFSSTGQLWDVYLNNTSLETEFDYSTFEQCRLHNFGQSISIKNSSFNSCFIMYSRRGNVSISDETSFNRTWLYLENTKDNLNTASVTNCSFTTDYTMAAIDIWNYNQYNILNNTIDGYYNGIQILQSGYGDIKKSRISDNTITNCTRCGILAYGTRGIVYRNHISNNRYGVWFGDHSSMMLYGYSGAETNDETQEIFDNESYEVYASQYSFPPYFRYNVIVDDDNAGAPGDPLVYHNAGTGGILLKDVRYNCWEEIAGSFVLAEDLYPGGYIWQPTWCPGDNDNTAPDPDEDMYEVANNLFETEDYTGAKSMYEMLIDQYPQSKFAKAAMQELFAVEKFVSNDYSNLKQFYANNTDPELAETRDYLVSKCDVKTENWSDAISYYENIILDPETMEDSIFAIIDLGYVYFMMENSAYKSAHTGNLVQYKPETKEQFFEDRDYLLSLIPGDPMNETMKGNIAELQEGKLLQNVPNPFKGSTQIWYKLDNESTVQLNVYNYTGQLISTINEGSKPKGNHYIDFDASGLKNGIYFYSININGQTTDSKKMTIMK